MNYEKISISSSPVYVCLWWFFLDKTRIHTECVKKEPDKRPKVIQPITAALITETSAKTAEEE